MAGVAGVVVVGGGCVRWVGGVGFVVLVRKITERELEMNSGSKVLGQMELEIWVGVETANRNLGRAEVESQVMVSVVHPVGQIRLVDSVTIPDSLKGDPRGDVMEAKLISIARHLLYDAESGVTVTDFVPVSQSIRPGVSALRRYQVTVRGKDTCAGYFIRKVFGGGHRLEGYGWVPGM